MGSNEVQPKADNVHYVQLTLCIWCRHRHTGEPVYRQGFNYFDCEREDCNCIAYSQAEHNGDYRRVAAEGE